MTRIQTTIYIYICLLCSNCIFDLRETLTFIINNTLLIWWKTVIFTCYRFVFDYARYLSTWTNNGSGGTEKIFFPCTSVRHLCVKEAGVSWPLPGLVLSSKQRSGTVLAYLDSPQPAVCYHAHCTGILLCIAGCSNSSRACLCVWNIPASGTVCPSKYTTIKATSPNTFASHLSLNKALVLFSLSNGGCWVHTCTKDPIWNVKTRIKDPVQAERTVSLILNHYKTYFLVFVDDA